MHVLSQNILKNPFLFPKKKSIFAFEKISLYLAWACFRNEKRKLSAEKGMIILILVQILWVHVRTASAKRF